ncbi:MAG: hypothetical protein DME26_08625, partial [Verrucomicrobia bacterium]
MRYTMKTRRLQTSCLQRVEDNQRSADFSLQFTSGNTREPILCCMTAGQRNGIACVVHQLPKPVTIASEISFLNVYPFLCLLFAVAFLLPALAAPGDVSVDFVHYADGEVSATALQPDGRIVIGGIFGSVEWANHYSIARLYGEGGLELSFNPNLDFAAVSMVLQADGKILIAGLFLTVGRVPKDYLARLNPDGTLDPDFNPELTDVSDALLKTGVGTIAVQP